MSHIYSALIFEGHDLGGSTFVYLDASFVWVVRDIDVFFPGPNTGASLSVVAASNSGTFYHIDDAVVDDTGIWHQWQGRQVFVPEAGAPTLRIDTGTFAGGADCRISGWKLTPP